MVVIRESELERYPDWSSIFKNKNPVYLEVGIGNGEFLEWIAQNNPDKNFVGVEVSRDYFKKAVNRILKARLKNVRLICTEGAKALCKYFSEESLSGLYLNFPDPWAKKKQSSRRLVNDFFPWLLQSRLKLEGTFVMVTDYEPYAIEVVENFEKCKAFAPLWKEGPLVYKLENYYQTKYARKWLSLGKNLYYIGFKKVKGLAIPKEVLKFYPLLEISKEDPLPLAVIESKETNLEKVFQGLKEGILWKSGNQVIKVLNKFTGKDSILLDTVISEGSFRQRVFVTIAPHRDGLIIKFHDATNPEPTRGAHRLVALLCKEILSLLPASKVVQHQCKKGIWQEVF